MKENSLKGLEVIAQEVEDITNIIKSMEMPLSLLSRFKSSRICGVGWPRTRMCHLTSSLAMLLSRLWQFASLVPTKSC